MVAFLVVGGMQTGKTTYVKTKIIPKYPNVLVYDVQNQYPELPSWKREKKGRFRISPIEMNFQQFVKLGQALTGFLFVYEEATQFMRGQISPEMDANIVGKAHTKNRFLFFFHSWRKTPPSLIEFCDYIIQFNTGSSDKISKVDNEVVEKNWLDLQNLPRFSVRVHKHTNQAKDNIF